MRIELEDASGLRDIIASWSRFEDGTAGMTGVGGQPEAKAGRA